MIMLLVIFSIIIFAGIGLALWLEKFWKNLLRVFHSCRFIYYHRNFIICIQERMAAGTIWKLFVKQVSLIKFYDHQ